ncbi:hypothetical protein EA187_11090 [Lujinxingia sediminis]|uniref:Uncharacterized protein n=1 Tax=Lujinxingia sediminis TaxID=2480984 RepID=A0ABY0CSL6_9DELT|nr:hypothetical protein [Lujinxingia sediminis]RVU44089.1 hypothetical protein EA187_11090 [Lujinxingia sediminis]
MPRWTRPLSATLALCLWSTGALAQQSEPLERVKPGELQSFEDVRIERISPHELSEIVPGLGRSTIATAEGADLPRPLNRQELERLRGIASTRTSLIMALVMPPRPYRQVPMVYIGHAVWVEPAPNQPPVLLSTADWIADARQLFLIDEATAAAMRQHGIPLASQPSPGAHRPSGSGIEDLLKNDADVLIELRAARKEPNLNLAHLVFTSDAATSTHRPSQGWPLHDSSRPAPSMIFAYSPERPDRIEPVQIHDLRSLEEAFQFYLPTTSTAILGAPIFSNTDHLVALNALRHPERSAVGLAVPPGALQHFIESLSER